MLVSDFDFDLPDDRIALRPAEPRESARLLRVDAAGNLSDAHIGDIGRFLRPGDLLVVNDTRVLPVQLHGFRRRDGSDVSVEATLIKATGGSQWQAFLKPGRKVRIGDSLLFRSDFSTVELQATVAGKEDDGLYALNFLHVPADLLERLHIIGAMPLPPYIRSKRLEDDQDKRDYQTIFANQEGSVAAPTAGLHFTSSLLEQLQSDGIAIERITLHVGAGTFLPVKVDDTNDHVMHAEFGVITQASADRINAARTAGGRIVCVGTTSLRLLESACDADGMIQPFAAETSIFITPGVRVRSCDLLMTNFHLPKSTLFMLVCALAGTQVMKAAYRHAVDSGYRFFSYGDACLLTNTSDISESSGL
ncbi:tRNA preQ1(34) S-adenosylmethionine ribosyltransferase-isomerase QueA [Asticcacaulis sp. AC402]|uniref:tRNA preQ1(34) S-adenosylmethionine ribosyltransferase-isomerase QueA n=1 Tax=Asticcacaulis sp. AC402 TaxID=1282361 RepID=UPI0003C3FE20|nr:tRNA preQ1(34) S-adenosylmethionine ribosyltransferase-isomerase QueA [Asticcacaulis sp. AC402]ESQ76464.1 S-adenosylmethionine tRNA ribosyltransferase [Asticcacaulis sp. AC402]